MNLDEAYSRESFLSFCRFEFLSDDFRPASTALQVDNGYPLLKAATLLGEAPSLGLVVLELEHQGVNDPRVMLSRDCFKLMKKRNIARALVVFYSGSHEHWRLSLVTSELDYDAKNNRIIHEFSNPRRQSFLLGPGARLATARQKLVKAGRVQSFDDLAGRFSLEVVNREFYRRIAELFTRLVGGTRMQGGEQHSWPGLLSLPSCDDRAIKQEFAVRLVGRIVFCQFLKEKGLVPATWLATPVEENCYHRHIEPLFFEILNTPRDKRHKTFRTPEADSIPFLNGGLFTPHAHDWYSYDDLTNSSPYLNTLTVPDEWLADFLGLLGEYNFTIDENTPVDVDLSIDPEMLGRIFENLLAEINPETGETARNKTGSFYTPREIVDYMVSESLVATLLKAVWPGDTPVQQAANASRLRDLFAWELAPEDSPAFDDNETAAIIKALHGMRCLDPACGSGAFPMGILQKALLALEKLDPKAEGYIRQKLERIDDDYIRAETERSLRAKGYQYLHKLSLVQSCIYGVDIQPIAVEMSRLRAFLSLIVDATVDDSKPNRGIDPLPNLEFKFVCANTLVKLPDQKLGGDLFANYDHVKDLRILRSRYLTASGLEKDRLKTEFLDKQSILYDALIQWSSHHHAGSLAAKLSSWDPFGDSACDWFDADWMFGMGEGFDVVIGNPPYIQLQSMGSLSALYGSQGYETFAKTGDIYCLFHERGATLLKQGGFLCYITSNKWMRAGYGKTMRAFLLERGALRSLLDFGDSNIFENATTYTNIILWEYGVKADSSTPPLVRDLSRSWAVSSNITSLTASSEACECIASRESWVLASEKQAALKRRIEAVGKPLKDWDVSINYGIKTGLNEAFIIDQSKYDELVAQDPKSAEILKPILRGRDIKRYKADWAGLYLVATFPARQLDIDDYPAVRDYLKSYGPALDQSGAPGSRKKTANKWFETQDAIAYWQDFDKPKVMWLEMAGEASFVYSEEDLVVLDTARIMVGDEIKYLQLVLNSKVNEFIFSKFYAGGNLQNETIRYKSTFMNNMPIPDIPPAQQRPFEVLVDAIQLAKREGCELEADFLEKLADWLVYGLYFEGEARAAGLAVYDEAAAVLVKAPETADDLVTLVARLHAKPALRRAGSEPVPLA